MSLKVGETSVPPCLCNSSDSGSTIGTRELHSPFVLMPQPRSLHYTSHNDCSMGRALNYVTSHYRTKIRTKMKQYHLNSLYGRD